MGTSRARASIVRPGGRCWQTSGPFGPGRCATRIKCEALLERSTSDAALLQQQARTVTFNLFARFLLISSPLGSSSRVLLFLHSTGIKSEVQRFRPRTLSAHPRLAHDMRGQLRICKDMLLMPTPSWPARVLDYSSPSAKIEAIFTTRHGHWRRNIQIKKIWQPGAARAITRACPQAAIT
jgi:hypothetical protein